MKKNAKKKATWVLTSAELQKQAEKFGINPSGYPTFASFMEALKTARQAAKDSHLATLAGLLKTQTSSERKATAEAVLAKVSAQEAEAEELRQTARKSKFDADKEIELCKKQKAYWNNREIKARAVKKTANQDIRSANQVKAVGREFRKEFKTIAKSIDALATL